MSYNVEMSTIHFYKKNNRINNIIKKEKSQNIYILVILIILVVFCLGIYYKKFFHTKRKLRKNELNEDFDFNIPINDIN